MLLNYKGIQIKTVGFYKFCVDGAKYSKRTMLEAKQLIDNLIK